MNTAFIYHWWSDKLPIEKLFRCPILCSIATLREHNPNAPIYVLDVSTETRDWSSWEKKLNFKAIKYTPYFRSLGFKNDSYSLTEPSRHIDVYNFGKTIKEDILFYVDSDVLFLKPIEEIKMDDRIYSPIYTAYFYFNKHGKRALEFIDGYRDLCLKCFIDDDFVNHLYPFCPYKITGRRVWSEVITYYVKKSNEIEWMNKLIGNIDLRKFALFVTAYQHQQINTALFVHLFFSGATKYDEMDAVALFTEFRKPTEKFLGSDFVENLKPGVKKSLSVYDEGFAKHIYELTNAVGYKSMPNFIDIAYDYVR